MLLWKNKEYENWEENAGTWRKSEKKMNNWLLREITEMLIKGLNNDMQSSMLWKKWVDGN